ncbi:isochorismatase family protein [Streptomyces sp. NPDC004539]|uniref:isochorismatase family protein n=1 Tax=Streptomyces sp. NPDC004539 TaxID=3154280 RepID=UPI0033A73A01
MPGIPRIDPYPLPERGDLPPNTAPWSLDPQRAVLLVHDMQQYFLRPLPPDLREQVEAHTELLLRYAEAARIPVAYSAQPGGMTEEERGLLRDFWGPGMRVAPADREPPARLAPRAGDWRITKWRYSAFFRTDLRERMRVHGRDQLVLCGVYAHIGLLATAIDAFSQDIETFLVADAVADFSERDHRTAVDYAAARCAVVLTTKEVVER